MLLWRVRLDVGVCSSVRLGTRPLARLWWTYRWLAKLPLAIGRHVTDWRQRADVAEKIGCKGNRADVHDVTYFSVVNHSAAKTNGTGSFRRRSMTQ